MMSSSIRAKQFLTAAMAVGALAPKGPPPAGGGKRGRGESCGEFGTVRNGGTAHRNKPCSCGSGVKFKRCCGAPPKFVPPAQGQEGTWGEFVAVALPAGVANASGKSLPSYAEYAEMAEAIVCLDD